MTSPHRSQPDKFKDAVRAVECDCDPERSPKRLGKAGERSAGAGERMTPLRIARLALLASLAGLALGVAIGSVAPEAGFLVATISTFSVAATALLCVGIQLGNLITSRQRPVEKPE